MWFGAVWKGSVGGLRRSAGVDGGFAVDEVMWGERDGRLGGGEYKAKLV